jgi:archaetidylinositol phosphate synthase
LRRYVNASMHRIGYFLARHGVEPNYVTILSLIFSITAFTLVYLGEPVYWYMVFLLLSGFMDVLDGSIARASGKVTVFGGFLDSTLDRFSDFFLIISLMYMGIDPLLVLFILLFSFMTSYTRARAESLGVKMEGVGIIERAERLLFLLIIAILVYVGLGFWAYIVSVLFLILSLITVAQRIIHVYMVSHRRG